MGYIGPIPAQVPLTSSDIEDGIITADKLATDSVETVKVKDVNITAGKLAATQDLSSKTITLPATVAGLGTGIDAATQLANKVPTANLGTGSASATTYLAGDQSYKALSEFNDDALRNDVATLVLHQATNANAAKYNLVNTNVDQYEDSTGVATFTDCARNAAGEYVSSVSETTSYDTIVGTWNSNESHGTGTWTGALTDDSVNKGSTAYQGCYSDFLYDLAADWRVRGFNVDSSGDLYPITYQIYSAIITTDTSEAAGANPSFFVDQGNTLNSSGNFTPATLQNWIGSSYASTIGASSLTDNSIQSTSSSQTVDCSSASAMARSYGYSPGTFGAYGKEVLYDRSANTITIKYATNAAFTTFHAGGGTTFTNVPSTGRFMFTHGDDEGRAATFQVSSTYNTADNTNFSYYKSSTESATGNYISTATTANAFSFYYGCSNNL